MSNQYHFIRQTAMFLLAFCLIFGLLPGFAAAQDESTADNEWGPGYTVTSNGLQIDGIQPNNPTNRVILDNDMFFEDPGWLILSAMHKLGRVDLRGIIITYEPNPQGWLDGGLKYWPGTQVADYNRMRMHAIGNGLSMMPHTLGAGTILVRPSSGNINDTHYTSSPGSQLIIEQADASTPDNPLIVFVGGQATTVANALLEKPSIANRMIVIYAAGFPRNYNTYDSWAAYVTAMRAPLVELGPCWGDFAATGVVQEWNFDAWPVTDAFRSHLNSKFVNTYCDSPMIVWLLDQSLFTGVNRRTVTGLSLNVPITHPTQGYETIDISLVSTSPYGHLFIPRSNRRILAIQNSWGDLVGSPAVWDRGSLPPPPSTAPAAPTNPSASVVSSSQINLNWADNSNNEYGFWISYRIGTGNWSDVANVGANITTYSHTGLSANTTYSYRVRAENTRGTSAWTTAVSATTASGSTPPAAPTNLSAIVASSSQINLSWADNSSNETGFRIERKTGSGGTWVQIATVDANITSYPNTGLTASTTYYYRVRAYNGAGNSAYSNEASATSSPEGMQGMLGLEDASGTRQQANSVDAIRFVAGSSFSAETMNARFTAGTALGVMRMAIYADNGGNPGAVLGETAEFSIAGGLRSEALKAPVAITGGNVYWIATWVNRSTGTNVTFVANDGVGTRFRATPAYSATNPFPGGSTLSYSADVTYAVFATGTTQETIPAPSNLSAIASSSSQINLSWADNSNNETGFQIGRKTGSGGTWGQIAIVGANVTTYSNTGLSAPTTYYYRVRAYNATDNSEWSNEANATTSDEVVGINDMDFPDLLINPNPFDSYIHITLQEKAQLKLYDISGRMRLIIKLEVGLNTIPTDYLEKGFYMINISGNERVFNKLMVK